MEVEPETSRCRFAAHITFATIGIIVGLGAGVSFTFPLENPDAGAFGFASAVAACLALTVHVLYRREFWNYQQHASLVRFMYTGCFTQLIGVVGFVVYVVLGTLQYQEQKKLLIHGRSYFLACVWCFMTWKWGFLLFLYSRMYRRRIRKAAGELLVQ